MFSIQYGLFVVTACRDGRDNGCITNTVMQVTSQPNRISVTVNKENLTHDMIKETGRFTASIIRDVDKFADFADCRRVKNGTLAVTKGTNAFISANVVQMVDLGTHTLFVGEVVEMEPLTDVPSATYAYYQEHIKPKPEPVDVTPEGKTVWRCVICGYEYEGEELPEDFICPICKHPASDFEKVS